MFYDNSRDLGAVTVEAERNNSVSDNISMEKYLWHDDSGASCHVGNDSSGMFDSNRIHSYLKIGTGKYMYLSRIGNKKIRIVQANGSTLDLILCDCIYVPKICINLKDYDKGSMYHVLVAWETGEKTYEPLNLIARDDPITCAEYALKHNLLDEPGWIRFRHYTRNKNTLGRIVNQCKVSSYRREPFWKFRVLVLRTHKPAMELDMKNIHKKWKEADETEIHQLLKYDCKDVCNRSSSV
jgi:hypothetical protein